MHICNIISIKSTIICYFKGYAIAHSTINACSILCLCPSRCYNNSITNSIYWNNTFSTTCWDIYGIFVIMRMLSWRMNWSRTRCVLNWIKILKYLCHYCPSTTYPDVIVPPDKLGTSPVVPVEEPSFKAI